MFWLYVNKGTATLHRGGCEDCNEGLGKTGSVDLSGKWHGPYELLEDVEPPGHAKFKPCKKCRPRQDW